MTPIIQLIKAIMEQENEKYEPMMERLGIVLKAEEKKLSGKALMKLVMQSWINAGDSLAPGRLVSAELWSRFRGKRLKKRRLLDF